MPRTLHRRWLPIRTHSDACVVCFLLSFRARLTLRIHVLSVIGATLLAITGCTSPRYLDAYDPSSLSAPTTYDKDDPRRLPMFTGNGCAIGWTDLLNAVEWAEIIIIGEQHDDAMGHAFQLAVMQDTLAHWPRAILSMEMLERDQQMLVEDYLDGYISQEFFVRRAGISRWGGHEGAWNDWYQPIVDVAKDARTRVIAANAPRRYVRLARMHGYGYLRGMSRDRRALFDLPRRIPRDAYRDRFYDVMLSMRGHGDDDEYDAEADSAARLVQDDAIEATFRSQMMWDATMAKSIIRARPSRDRKIVHLVGRFHSDFEGGLVTEIRRPRPTARILAISMAPLEATHLRDDDEHRADIIVYTGEQADEAGDDEVVFDDAGEAARHE